jgi:DNA mismatch repair protein MutS
MQVDKITQQDIGLFDNEESIGLASHLNFCKSNGGKYLFDSYLSQPLSTQIEIENRQSAIAIFIKHYEFVSAMKITNGTALVIDKFFETSFKHIPVQISKPGAYWYQFWDKSDYSLIEYSVGHLSIFIQHLMQWVTVFEKEDNNSTINSLVQRIHKYTNHPNLAILRSSEKITNPQHVLQLGYFFLYQYKQNTLQLLQYFYELDAHFSMATAVQKFQFEFPTWISSHTPVLKIEAAAHPLVVNPITNNLTLSQHHNFLFLTGANMAGKSTFIKTVGIVIYLAHVGMGAPAKKIEMTVMDGLITNLTIADNVVKGESYFFNEVQRIKNTVERIKDGRKYCVLIDELFKGTNIQDAMKCSIKVIEGLQKSRSSLFILSTHLYEISDNLTKYDHIQFSYFETKVTNKELVFHYHLKEGVSQDRIGYLILEREGVVELLDNL